MQPHSYVLAKVCRLRLYNVQSLQYANLLPLKLSAAQFIQTAYDQDLKSHTMNYSYVT